MNTPDDELRFDDRVVIVTGAGRGMGRAHAVLLAERGAKVVVNDLGTATMEGGAPSASVADAVVAEITSSGGEAVASTDTVATKEGASAIVHSSIDRWGRVDAIIHNAGIAKFTALPEIDEDEYRQTLAVHLDGAFFLTAAAWPYMQQQGYGKVLYISSTAGLFGVPFQAAYAMAKTGLLGLMNVARLEGSQHGMAFNTLGVAAHTRMTQSMFEQRGAPAMDEWWHRYVRSEQVSAAVAWLVHESCPANGETFDTKGGHIGRMFLAATRGHTDLDLTPEAVRDHFDAVRSEDGYQVFRSGWDSANYHFGEMIKAGAPPIPAE